MIEITFFAQLRTFIGKCPAINAGFALIFAAASAMPANAQDLFAFQDDSQLTESMFRLAASTSKALTIPEPCLLHVVTVAGGGNLFARRTFDAMNLVLTRGVDEAGRCEIQLHELNRDAADALFTRVKPQGANVLVLNVTYIPLANNIVAFAKLHDGTGRLIGESGRFDLPVIKSTPQVETVAAIKETAKAVVKETTRLLTEVHFDPASAEITVVGKRKINKAIEAIKKQNPREIRIFGFTDTIGDAAANKVMAGVRAANVARLLKQQGITVPLIVEGKGEVGGPYSIPDNVSEPLNRCVGIIAVGGSNGQ